MTVGLACPTELAARRWRALTSLQDVRSDVARPSPSAHGSSGRRVLVVDAADHLSPRALVELLDRSASSRTKVVLVLGGTVPGNGPSVAGSLDRLAEEQAGRGRSPGCAAAVDRNYMPAGPRRERQPSGFPAGDLGPGIAYRGRRHGSYCASVGGRGPGWSYGPPDGGLWPRRG